MTVKEQGEPTLVGNIKATRQDWINLALEALVSEGVESVRILPFAQTLGVSRSSFYWYFKSRQDLLDQLLDHWRNTNTRAIIERAEACSIRASTLQSANGPAGPRL
jgi:AcrR family transcriptional regulator